jgi:hypothetical protein
MLPASLRRPFAVAVFCVACVCATQALRAKPRPTRALWVWGEVGAELPGWASSQGIDTLLFEIPTSRIGAASTRDVLRGAEREGLRVWALSGRPEWATSPRDAKRWIRAAARTPGIAGIVLDVEPYLLEAWKRDRARTANRYLRMLRVAARAAGDLPLMVAVPFWFDHDTDRTAAGTLTARIAAEVDALVVMAYRDEVAGRDGIVTLSRGEMEIVAAHDKVALVGLQTARDELDKLTFYEEGPRALDAAMVAVERAFENSAGFGGVALHHYRAYRELRGARKEP